MRILTLGVIISFWVGIASATVIFRGSTVGGGGQVELTNAPSTMISSSTSPCSGSFSITATGSNRVAIARVYIRTSDAYTNPTVTYGGQAMTAGTTVYQGTSNTDMHMQFYYLVDPPTGTQTLSVSTGMGMGDMYADVIGFSGANQTTPIRDGSWTGDGTTTTGSKSLVIPTVVGDMTLSMTASPNDDANTNQTLDSRNSNNFTFNVSDHATSAGTTTTHTWSNQGSGQQLSAGCSIQP